MAATPGAWATRLQTAWTERGPLARLLFPVSLVFGWFAGFRRLLYRSGMLRTQHLGLPVIVVGNLIAGGAGKTPAVIAIVRMLRGKGFHPGIVTRGYGRRETGLVQVHADTPALVCGDEPLLLHLRTGAPVTVSRDRVAAAQALMHAHPQVDVLVSDDGLQHLRLARDVQILVFDERGAGNGWLLPAGPLREPMPGRVPARSLVLYNAPAPSTTLPGTLARRGLSGIVELAAWWQGAPAARQPLQRLQGRSIIAAAGMARPQRFFDMLVDAGLDIETLPLPDHHDYATLPWPAQTPDVIVTEKDAVKLMPDRMTDTRVWVAALDFTLGAEFDAALTALITTARKPRREHDDGNPTA